MNRDSNHVIEWAPRRRGTKALHGLGLALVIAGTASAQYSSRSFAGTQQGSQIGYNTRHVGDVNGDGFDDVLMGSPYFDAPGAPAAGIAIVLSGGTGLALHTYSGTHPSEDYAQSLAEAGDVDGDGRADFMISSQQFDPVTGTPSVVTIYSGATFLPLRFYPGGTQPWFTAGVTTQSLAPAGDANADGFVDAVMGAFVGGPTSGSNVGAAHLVSGSNGAVLHTWFGDDSAAFFGSAVSGAGDVDGDGKDDVLIGSALDSDFGNHAGSAEVYGGTGAYPLLLTLASGVAGENFGVSVAGLGDVTGDNRSDLAIGGYGAVRVYSGANGGLVSTMSGLASTQFGTVIAAVGDHDGNGKNDVLVGAAGASPAGALSGSAFLYSAPSGALLRTFHGSAANEQFGYSLDGGGDTNNDGQPDLVVGSTGAPAGLGFGAVHLFESACQTLYAYGAGCPGTGGFVPKLAMTGCVSTGPGSLTMQITKAHGGAMALLFVGIAPFYYAPPSGCALLVNPLLAPATTLPLSGTGPGNGAGSFTFPLTPSSLPLDVYLQVFATDPKPLGYATSNGFLIGKPGT